MHRVASARRQPGHDRLRGRGGWSDAVATERVAHDSLGNRVALLGVERSVVDPNTGPSAVTGLRVRSKAPDDIGLSIIVGIAQCDDKAAGGRRRVVIPAAPGVDV